jgi:hypothetical protein
MTDGLRWQETFGGADQALLDQVKDPKLTEEFWRDTPEARREALLPFVWSVVAKQGQLFGNRNKGSVSQVTNGLNFSYPGYNETLCGYPDARVKSNDPIPNPNVTVFEWINKQQTFRGKVAAFGAWNVISSVFNADRCGFLTNSGYDPLITGKGNPEIKLLNRLKAEQPRYWDDEPFDALTFHTSIQYAKLNRPRLFYLSLGETDDWAHENKYGRYLESAHRFDAYVKELWNTLQAIPQYRGKTTLILTCDHGRGDGRLWTSHGVNVPNSEYTWMGFLGPDTPATGERTNSAVVTNGQIAATIATLLGLDYNKSQPKAAPVITEVVSK